MAKPAGKARTPAFLNHRTWQREARNQPNLHITTLGLIYKKISKTCFYAWCGVTAPGGPDHQPVGFCCRPSPFTDKAAPEVENEHHQNSRDLRERAVIFAWCHKNEIRLATDCFDGRRSTWTGLNSIHKLPQFHWDKWISWQELRVY